MIISTFPNEIKAEKLVKTLLEEKLIACANIIPGVKSLYWWQESIIKDVEVLVFIKTRKELETQVMEKIKINHTYEVPSIYKI